MNLRPDRSGADTGGNCSRTFANTGIGPCGDVSTAGNEAEAGTALADRAGTDEGRIGGEPGGEAAGNQGD